MAKAPPPTYAQMEEVNNRAPMHPPPAAPRSSAPPPPIARKPAQRPSTPARGTGYRPLAARRRR